MGSPSFLAEAEPSSLSTPLHYRRLLPSGTRCVPHYLPLAFSFGGTPYTKSCLSAMVARS
jgi:hypothetical protein